MDFHNVGTLKQLSSRRHHSDSG